MPRIRFTEHVETKAGTKYVKDKIYDMEPAFADRWVRRGLATIVGDALSTIEKAPRTSTGRKTKTKA